MAPVLIRVGCEPLFGCWEYEHSGNALKLWIILLGWREIVRITIFPSEASSPFQLSRLIYLPKGMPPSNFNTIYNGSKSCYKDGETVCGYKNTAPVVHATSVNCTSQVYGATPWGMGGSLTDSNVNDHPPPKKKHKILNLKYKSQDRIWWYSSTMDKIGWLSHLRILDFITLTWYSLQQC